MPPLKHAWRRLTQCRELALRLVAVTALLAIACDRDAPTGPELKAGNATPLTVSPASLSLPIPPRAGTTLTAQVQFTGTITARTSDAACATVTPLSVPATKPPGSSQYVATFSVTPVEKG